jgi:2-amino-4-hydroxy-6-hydroxymethyldihydropteridine diphosphokinase
LAQRYLIALGSNRRHHRHGPPERVLLAALKALDQDGIKLKHAGPVLRSQPLGPSLRRYANSAALVRTRLDPEQLLAALQAIERGFGRRRGGQRWSARVLDLDIVLWSGGAWASSNLTIPHPRFRERHFVLGPAVSIAPAWRDPLTGLTLRQLAYRNSRAISSARRA